jgi:glycosyltransferase involved in cell wall biosynthesis
MIVSRVIRDEGIASAVRRARERIAERIEDARFFSSSDAPIVNVAPGGTGSRTGGVAVQLRARLRVERMQRKVLLTGELPKRPIHFEGTGRVANAPYIVSVHDLTLLHDRELLRSAAAIVFASQFLRDQYQLDGQIIEPGLSVAPAILPANSRAIAFAGAVQRDKGGYLLPGIARALAKRGETLHVFGRGDGDLLRTLRAMTNVRVYGYYRAGTLAPLLRRHGIGLVLVPSIVPEAFCLTMSEAWAAGAAVAAFDIGAQGERIKKYGGGWVAPLASGAGGMMQIIDRWTPTGIPSDIPTAAASARAYLDLYRRLGWLG